MMADAIEAIIWICDLRHGGDPRRLTYTGRNRYPVWSPDGRHVAFQSDRDGDYGLFWQLADGSQPAVRLSAPHLSVRQFPEAWSGKTLAFAVIPPTDYRLFALSTEDANAVKPLLADVPAQHASFSPDGRWLAYTSTEIGHRHEVFVQPIPSTGAPYQVSTEGGTTPLWSPDGSQLYYWANLSRHLVAVDVRTEPTFNAGKRVTLPIDAIFGTGLFPERNYDLTPDGKQFVVVTELDRPSGDPKRPPAQQIELVLNWATELNARVPRR